MMSPQEFSAIFAYLNVITTMNGKPEQLSVVRKAFG